MTIESLTSAVGNSIWQQVQSQQSQRAADRAMQEANALQSRAREARTNADRAQQNARSLEASASQAQQKASQISLSMRSDNAAADTNNTLQSYYSSLPQIVAKPAPVSETVAPAVTTTVASTGSSGSATVGTVIDTTA
jgi:hypothetical protein